MSKTGLLRKSATSLRWAVLAVGLFYIALYIAVALWRIRYPFELEWMEGGVVDHVRRILTGRKLYVKPSLDFIPYVYPPLYFYISAGVSRILGVGFVAPRLVSFVSSLGCFVCVFLLVKRETGSGFAGAAASSLFAATFRISGNWFDIARVDSLFLFLLLAAIYLVRFKRSPLWYTAAGALIFLSFQTKQVALLIALPLMLYCAFANWRLSGFFVGTIVVAVGASMLTLDRIHDGWYRYYVFDLPRQHDVVRAMYAAFWRSDIWSPLKIACVMSALYLSAELLMHVAAWGRPRVSDRPCPQTLGGAPLSRSGIARVLDCLPGRGAPRSGVGNRELPFYLLTALGMVGGAYVSRLHSGGYLNVLLPAYAIVAVLFGLALDAALRLAHRLSATAAPLMAIAVYLACTAQFVALRYNPYHQIPTVADLEAGRSFVATLRQIRGDVFVPCHGYLPALAGKPPHAHAMAVEDVLRGDQGPGRSMLLNEIRNAMRQRRFSAVIIDGVWDSYLHRYLAQSYVRRAAVFNSDRVFWPVTGGPSRPQWIYTPRSARALTPPAVHRPAS